MLNLFDLSRHPIWQPVSIVGFFGSSRVGSVPMSV